MLQKLILIASLFAYVVLVGCQKELEVPATPIAIVDTHLLPSIQSLRPLLTLRSWKIAGYEQAQNSDSLVIMIPPLKNM